MPQTRWGKRAEVMCLLLFTVTACNGCLSHRGHDLVDGALAREIDKITLPPYIIQPPDILQLDAIRLVPLPPYKIEPLDVLGLHVSETPPDAPISGYFPVASEGTINLGSLYGKVLVEGLTLEDAKTTIEKHIKKAAGLLKPKVEHIVLAETQGVQQVRGPHLVRPDGTVGLGVYGGVTVAGLTIEEAKDALEAHLLQYFKRPQISVDVSGFNSMVYYVIFDGGGYGQQMVRLPVTGSETILDAISSVNGLPPISSKHHIWIARPAPPQLGCDQILPVDWKGIVACGRTGTNYQIMPGDRIYVQADCLIATDNWLAKIIAPMERVFGVTLLGNATVRALHNSRSSSNPFSGF